MNKGPLILIYSIPEFWHAPRKVSHLHTLYKDEFVFLDTVAQGVHEENGFLELAEVGKLMYTGVHSCSLCFLFQLIEKMKYIFSLILINVSWFYCACGVVQLNTCFGVRLPCSPLIVLSFLYWGVLATLRGPDAY